MSNNGHYKGVGGAARPKQQSKRRVRRSSKLQQIRECTITAVSHLSEKLSPVNNTPHLELLRQMCQNFINSLENAFKIPNISNMIT